MTQRLHIRKAPRADPDWVSGQRRRRVSQASHVVRAGRHESGKQLGSGGGAGAVVSWPEPKWLCSRDCPPSMVMAIFELGLPDGRGGAFPKMNTRPVKPTPLRQMDYALVPDAFAGSAAFEPQILAGIASLDDVHPDIGSGDRPASLASAEFDVNSVGTAPGLDASSRARAVQIHACQRDEGEPYADTIHDLGLDDLRGPARSRPSEPRHCDQDK